MRRIIDLGSLQLCLDWVLNDDRIDLAVWTGRAAQTLPKKFRDADTFPSLTRASSLMFEIGDFHCDPRSCGIAGNSQIGFFYRVREQQFKRYVAPQLDYLV
jgi:hypothetical protein